MVLTEALDQLLKFKEPLEPLEAWAASMRPGTVLQEVSQLVMRGEDVVCFPEFLPVTACTVVEFGDHQLHEPGISMVDWLIQLMKSPDTLLEGV